MIRRVSSCSGVAGGTHHLHLGEADTRTDSYGLVSLCPSGHTSSTTPRLRSTEMIVSAPRRSPTFTTRPPGWRTALLEPARSLATSQAGDDASQSREPGAPASPRVIPEEHQGALRMPVESSFVVEPPLLPVASGPPVVSADCSRSDVRRPAALPP